MSHTTSTLPLIGIGAPPIGRLPVEVLSKVMLLAAPPEEDVDECQPRSPPTWFVLAGVCLYWRDVINGNPMFWRCIDVGLRLEWLDLCLQRSAQLKVNILLRETLDVSPAVLSNVLAPHKDRISVFIDFSLTCDEPLCPLPMPQLRFLNLAITHVNHPEEDVDHDGACPIIPLLPAVGEHNGTFPQLESAGLTGIAIAIPVGLVFSSLICLSLRNCSFSGPIAHPSCHILHVLDACPSLQEVTLSISLASLMHPDMDGLVPRVVAVPELCFLHTFDDPELISEFLSRLQFRDDVDIDLSTYVSTEPELVHALPHMLPSPHEDHDKLAILRSITYVAVEVDLLHAAKVNIKALVDKEHPFHGRIELTVTTERHDVEDDDMQLRYNYDVAPAWTVLVDLPSIFPPWTPIKTLACYGDMRESSHWEETLEPYQVTLQNLVLDNVGSSAAALSLFQILGEREGRASMLCPNLKIVWIHDVEVSLELMAAIRACVQRRCDEGCPLSGLLLDLVDCTGRVFEIPPDLVCVSTFPEGSVIGLFNEEMKRMVPGFKLEMTKHEFDRLPFDKLPKF